MLRRNPIDFFNLIWSDEAVQKISKNTDLITRSKIEQNQENLKPHSRLRKWSSPSKADIRRLMGIVISMGVIRLPSITDYWSSNNVLCIPFFREVISRDKFWNLHVADPLPDNVSYPSKSYKIQWLLDHVNMRSQELYEMGQNIAVDETMVKFKGRIGFRQYNPKKPTKWGMKLFTLADSNTSYMWQQNLYVGADGRETELSKCAQHVLDLVEPLSNLSHTVYADRYFWTLGLAQRLIDSGFNINGTVMPNRKGFPQRLKSAKHMKPGEIIAFRKDDILMLQWKDNRVVTMITNNCRSDEWCTIKPKNPNHDTRNKPKCIADYNKHMNGVDVNDQLCTYYL
ncbi:piggyBac transposable element-derived protein 4-like [Patella vulgata]|uniref:piggyBac transposable element-derived protein 4-like n=1 Tax=Patella vulgata TaxID=6465 RepID=UPI0024A7EBED|nr:piggyBac transposable element-derived protein 4-like [Patella vulgata]